MRGGEVRGRREPGLEAMISKIRGETNRGLWRRENRHEARREGVVQSFFVAGNLVLGGLCPPARCPLNRFGGWVPLLIVDYKKTMVPLFYPPWRTWLV